MAVKEYDLEQPVEKLLDIAARKFGPVEFQAVSVGDSSFDVLQIKDMQAYIDKLMDKTRSGKTINLPLWAKIWPSSLVMGFSLAKFPLKEGSRVLEIGGGASLGGLVMARRGFQVAFADKDPDALLFSRINALKNGLGDIVSCRLTTFTEDLGDTYDCVTGCELLFDDTVFGRLAGFLDKILVEGSEGEVFLSLELKRSAQTFFTECSKGFNIMKSTATFKDQETGEDKPVNLFRFKRK